MTVLRAQKPDGTFGEVQMDSAGNLLVADGATPANPIYLGVAFSAAEVMFLLDGSNSTRLQGVISADGKTWARLGRRGLHVESGGPGYFLRDPSICRFRGKWYVAYTVQDAGSVARIIESDDLVTWSFVKDVTFQPAGETTTSVWAPEWYIEGESVRLYASTEYDGSFHVTWSTPTNMGDLSGDWTTAQKVSIKRDNVEIAHVIDPFLMKLPDGSYALWVKDKDAGGEDYPNVLYGVSESPDGPFITTLSGDWAGWGVDTFEGPCLVRLVNGRYRLYMDHYGGTGDINWCDSTNADDISSWGTPVSCSMTGGGMSHGTFMRVTDPALVAEVRAAQAALADAQHDQFVIDINEWTESVATFIVGRPVSWLDLTLEDDGLFAPKQIILLNTTASLNDRVRIRLTIPALASCQVYSGDATESDTPILLTDLSTPPGATAKHFLEYVFDGTDWVQEFAAP